jgi:hypothetical protein
MTTSQISAFKTKTRHRMWVPKIQAVPFDARAVPIDPYFLGVLLGDGGLTSDTVRLSCADPEIIDGLRSVLPTDHQIVKAKGKNCDWSITCGKAASRVKNENRHIRQMVRALGVDGYSFDCSIPMDSWTSMANRELSRRQSG